MKHITHKKELIAQQPALELAVRYREGKRFKWVRRNDDKRKIAVFTSRRAAEHIASVYNGKIYDLKGDLDVMLIASTE